MIASSATENKTNNRRNNPSTRIKTVSDSNKLSTPASTSTTTANNNTNNAHTKNSENNTGSKLIPSSIDGERYESEKCVNVYAANEDVKGKIPVLNLDQ